MVARVYYADVEPLYDERLFAEELSIQLPYRRDKVLRYRFQKDGALSLGAGMLLRYALDVEGEEESEPVMGDYGKPSMPDLGLHYNLSHSGTKVMCAVSESDIGCDVEQVSNIDLEIARRFFFGTEYDCIASESEEDSRREAFFRFWTLKESFMKATGLGMNLPLDSFRIDLGNPPVVFQDVDSRVYSLKEYCNGDGYRYACCSAGAPLPERMTAVDLARVHP